MNSLLWIFAAILTSAGLEPAKSPENTAPNEKQPVPAAAALRVAGPDDLPPRDEVEAAAALNAPGMGAVGFDRGRVRSLTIYDNARFGDKEMPLVARFSEVEFIDICGCPITDRGLAHLTGLKKLQKLALRKDQNPTDAGLAQVGRISICNLTR
jgi:hypothetical protein